MDSPVDQCENQLELGHSQSRDLDLAPRDLDLAPPTDSVDLTQ